MLDRMISGAGAVTDGADRSVRLLTSSSSGSPFAARPGSVAGAILLFVIAGLLLFSGIEATDPATPTRLDPATVSRASSVDLGERMYAAMDGSLLTTWVETFDDANANGIEDPDEHGFAWFYWLVDPKTRRGVTVRSTRAPASILTFQGAGLVVRDPHDAVSNDDGWFDREVAAEGLDVDSRIVIDTTHAVGATVPLDLASGVPSDGTAVDVVGSRTGAYRLVCGTDRDRDHVCDDEEIDGAEVAVFDPTSRHAVLVLLRDVPEFSSATLTGLLRREERSVDDARTTYGTDFSDLDIDVSARYVLDERVAPGTAPLAFVLALVLVVVGTMILAGLAGGYLIYRRSQDALPAPATTFSPGERSPLRVTGLVRTRTGLEHVREAPADLVRFVLGRDVSRPADDVEGGDADEGADDVRAATTTLLVERADMSQGVALGRGELQRVSSGHVMTLRAPRPALRVVAGTGPLLLSFDTDAERDRAAAELLAEAGLEPDGVHVEPA
ncbi:MAG: hypothetical protein ACJ77X_03945 [Chloroflexota bacterium]